jgi:hypothetical protein
VITDPDFANVVLLLDMETGVDGSTSFIDRSSSPRTVTANADAQVDTALAKYGTRSCLLDGTGDFLSANDTPDFNIGTADFTVEGWFRTQAVTTAQALICLRLTADSDTLYIYREASNHGTEPNKLRLSDSSVTRATSTSTLSNATFQHLAWTRASGVHRIFIDGTVQASTWSAGGSPAGAYNPTAIRIGMHPLGVQPMNGSIDEVRITNNVARYTANFTPPTAAFPTS